MTIENAVSFHANTDMPLSSAASHARDFLVMDRDWNLAIVGGVSADGLFADRAVQPVVILQEDSASDDGVMDALLAFLDRTLMAALRPR